MCWLRDILTKLDPGRGEEGATGNEDVWVNIPEVVELEFVGNADSDVEYCCKNEDVWVNAPK